MRQTVETIRLEVKDADVLKATRNLNTMDKSIDKNKESIKRMAKATKTMTLAIGGMAAAYAGAVVKALDFAVAIDRQSKLSGISAARFQSLTFSLEKMGFAQEQVTDMLKDYTGRLGQAAEGNKTMQDAYKSLGVNIADSNGNLLDSEIILNDVITALGKQKNAAARSAAASKIFGEEGGRRLSSALGKGSEAIFNMEKQAHDLGLVLKDDLVANAVEAKNQLATVAAILKTQLYKAIIDTTPEITKFTDALISDPDRLADVTRAIVGVANGVLYLVDGLRNYIKLYDYLSGDGPLKAWDKQTAVVAQYNEQLAILEAQMKRSSDTESLAGQAAKKSHDDLVKIRNEAIDLETELREAYEKSQEVLKSTEANKTSTLTQTVNVKVITTNESTTKTSKGKGKSKSKEAGYVKGGEDIEARINQQIEDEKVARQEARLQRLFDNEVRHANQVGQLYLETEKRKEDLTLHYVNTAGSAMASFFSAQGSNSKAMREKVVSDIRAMLIQMILFKSIAAASGGSLVVGSSGNLISAPSGTVSPSPSTSNNKVLTSRTSARGIPNIAPTQAHSTTNNNNITVTSNSADPKQVSIEVVQAIAKETTKNEINKNNSRPTRR